MKNGQVSMSNGNCSIQMTSNSAKVNGNLTVSGNLTVQGNVEVKKLNAEYVNATKCSLI